jgi:hypothetical protein
MFVQLAATFCLVGLIVLAGAPEQSGLPFTLHRGFLILFEGEIGEMRGLTFILDTGTSRTVLDRRVARALGLRGTPSQLLSFNGSIEAQQIEAPSIRLGPISAVSPRILAADLSRSFDAQGVRADGILGADVLRGTCFSIDYTARRLVFGPGGRWDASLPFDRRSPYPVVEVMVDSTPFRLIVDTASEGLVLFERAVPSSWAGRLMEPRRGSDAAGQLPLRAMRTNWIWLGLTSWRDQQVYVIREAGPDPSHYDGVLGPLALDIAELQFDFEGMTLRWRSTSEVRY